MSPRHIVFSNIIPIQDRDMKKGVWGCVRLFDADQCNIRTNRVYLENITAVLLYLLPKRQ